MSSDYGHALALARSISDRERYEALAKLPPIRDDDSNPNKALAKAKGWVEGDGEVLRLTDAGRAKLAERDAR